MELPNEFRRRMPRDIAEIMKKADTALFTVVGEIDGGLYPHAWIAPELDRETGAQLLRKLAFRLTETEYPEPRAMVTATIAHIPHQEGEPNAHITLNGDVEALGAVGIISALMYLVQTTAKKAGIPVTFDHAFTTRPKTGDGNGAYL